MRLLGKQFLSNGHPVVVAGKLLKDATIETKTRRSDGSEFQIFNAFMKQVNIKNSNRNDGSAIGVRAMGDIVSCLLPWEKGTTLLVLGELVLDDYATKKNGKETYIINAEFIMPQTDYRAQAIMEMSEVGAEKLAQRERDAGLDSESDYDPTF